MRKLAEVLRRVEGHPVPDWLHERQPSAPRPLFGPAPAPPAADPAKLERELEEARSAAEIEGLKAAQAKVETLVERYMDGIGRLAEAARDARRPPADEVVALAVVIAREILERELTVDRRRIVDTVDAALHSVHGQGGVTVRLGRADLAYLTQRRPDLAGVGIRFVEDESLGVGGCVVETDETVADATIEARLAAVARSVAEVLRADAAQEKLAS